MSLVVSEAPSTIDVTAFLDAQKLSRFQMLIAVLSSLVVAVDGFDAQAIGYVAPSLSAAWALPPGALGPVFGAGVFGMMIGALAFGPIADRVGRKPVILLCLLVFGACSILTVTAHSLSDLSVWRLLTGFGLGGGYPNAIALTCEYSPRRARARMIMFMFIGFGLGSAAGGAVAAQLTAAHGWTAVFWIGGLLPLILIPALMVLLPESLAYLTLKEASPRRIGALMRAINPSLSLGPEPRFTLGESHAGGFPVRHLFRNGRAIGTAMLWIMFAAGLFDIYFLIYWLPTITHGAGIALSQAVLLTAGMQVAIAVGTVLFGVIIDRIGPFGVLPVTFLLAAGGVASVGLTANGSLGLIATSVFVAGFFVGGSQNAVNALCAMYYPTFMRSTGVSWGHGMGRFGSIVGTVAGGIMLSQLWSLRAIFTTAAVPMLLAAFAALLMASNRRRDSATCQLT